MRHDSELFSTNSTTYNQIRKIINWLCHLLLTKLSLKLSKGCMENRYKDKCLLGDQKARLLFQEVNTIQGQLKIFGKWQQNDHLRSFLGTNSPSEVCTCCLPDTWKLWELWSFQFLDEWQPCSLHYILNCLAEIIKIYSFQSAISNKEYNVKQVIYCGVKCYYY